MVCLRDWDFVHTGHDKSFVYDIADLYKADTSIPLAFKIASDSNEGDDIGTISRQVMRDLFRENNLSNRITKDLQFLMGVEENDIFELETISLWDDKNNHVKYGINYEDN